MHYKRSRSTSRKELKRIEHKSARQAEKDALNGNLHAPRTLSWSKNPMSREKNLPLLDGPLPRKPQKKNRKKWCKGRVGRKHNIVYKPLRTYTYFEYERHIYGWVCDKCGRQFWGYRPETPKHKKSNDHWTQANIKRRLAGDPCQCETCP